MPSRSSVPLSRDIPGAPIVGALAVALAALIAVALLAWFEVRRVGTLAADRSTVNAYREAVGELRMKVLDVVVQSRTFAITGDDAALTAALQADLAAEENFARARTLGLSLALPDRLTRIRAYLDSGSARLQRVRSAGADGRTVALDLAREGGGALLVTAAVALLDSAIADATVERRRVVSLMDRHQRRLTMWIPAFAALALLLAALAVMLLRAQAAARARDVTRFGAIFDSAFQFIGLLSRDGRLLEANRTALEFGGVRAEDVIGKPFWEAPWWSLSAESQMQLQDAVARAAGGAFVRYPVEVAGAGGRRVTIDFSIKPAFDAQGRVEFLVPEGRDITELQAAKHALAESEERWNFALTGTDLGVWDWNAATDEVFFSERWKSMLGYAPDEIGNSLAEWSSRVHPDDWAHAEAAVRQHRDGQTPFYEAIFRMRAKDGSYREILDRGKVISRDADGRPLRIIGTHQDITEQRQVEESARELQRQMASLLRFSPSLISVIDRDGRYVQASASIATAIGRTVEDIVGRRLDDLLPPATAATFRGRLDQVLRTGRMLDVEDDVGSPGEARRYRTVLFPMRDESDEITAVGSVAINVTDAHRARLRLEAALDENRVLQGLLSICAQCKRIRDSEDQQWKPVESYVQSHSAATFSHGLCPSCAAAFLRENGFEPDAP